MHGTTWRTAHWRTWWAWTAGAKTAATTATKGRSRAGFLGARFVYREIASFERLIVEQPNRFLRSRRIRELNKREATLSSGLTIDRQKDAGEISGRREMVADLVIGGVIREIADK